MKSYYKQIAFIILIVTSSFGAIAQQQAQSNQAQQQAQQQALAQILKPSFVVEDVVIVLQILNNIELVGNEIDSFLNVKKTLQALIKKAQDNSMQATDIIKAEIQVQTAQDMLTFLQRGKLTGQVAEKYKRFIDSIVESAKALSQPAKSN